jgi:hypothetical protein
MPVIPTLRRERQEDLELKASWGYTARHCLKKHFFIQVFFLFKLLCYKASAKCFLSLLNVQETLHTYHRTFSISERHIPFPRPSCSCHMSFSIMFLASTLTQCPQVPKRFNSPTSLRGQLCEDAHRRMQEVQIWLCY